MAIPEKEIMDFIGELFKGFADALEQCFLATNCHNKSILIS